MQIFKIIACIVIFLAALENVLGQYTGYFSKSERIVIDKLYLSNVAYHSAFASVPIEADTVSRQFKILPLLNSNIGFSSKQKVIYSASPGLFTSLPMGKKISLWLALSVNIERYSNWIASQIDSNRILPEGGKALTLGKTNYYRPLLLGELSYVPLKYCAFDVGYGKKHWGDGYRSLWLSDYSAYYPYLQLRVHFWRIQYHILWGYLKDINTQAASGNFLNKYGVFHFFDFKVTHRLSLGFFESVIWWDKDASTQRGIDPSYLNPIIFFRPVEYSLHSPDNANLGLHVSLLLGQSTRLYQQLFIDDLSIKKIVQQPQWWGNKYGLLAGIKTYRLFGVPNLYSQFEYSRVRPYTYSHSSSALNYGTNYHPLGHPLGANFEEWLFVVRCNKGRWSVLAKTSMALQGRDSLPTQNVGQNIYRSYLIRQTHNDEAVFLQGERHRLFWGEVKIYHTISKRFPIHGFVSLQHVTDNSPNSIAETIVRIGITAQFFNDERDY